MKITGNIFRGLLRNEEEEVPDNGGGGMASLMDEFFKGGTDGVMPDKDIQPIIDAEPEEVAAKAEPDAEPDKAAKPAKIEKPDEDSDEFPDIGEEVEEEPETFDEDGYDKETQALLKSLEEKGHPGDVYKKLRAELKEAKQATTNKQVNVDEIPEYLEAKKELEALKPLKDEVEGLRQQRDELLKVTDEVAVETLPEFIQGVKEPLKAMDTDLSAIAQATGVDKAALLAVIREKDLGKQDTMLGELEGDLSRRALARLERIMEDYPKVIETRDKMYENKSDEIRRSRENQEVEQRKQSEAQIQEFQSNTKSAFDRYAKSIPGFLDSTGNLSQRAQTEMKKAMAINIHDLSTGDMAFLAFSARAIGPMREELRRLESLTNGGKSPSSKPAKIADPGSTKPNSTEEPESFMEAMKGKDFTFNPNFAGSPG